MTTSAPSELLLEEPNLRITRAAIVTPDEEVPLTDVSAVERYTYKPFLVPLALSVFGIIVAVVAVQTRYWLDFVACIAMLGGGMYWRHKATRYVLRVERNGKKEAVWQTADLKSLERALACLGELVGQRAA